MSKTFICAITTALVALLASSGIARAAADPELSAKHVAAAEAAAGEDLQRALGNCKNIGNSFEIPHDKIHALLEKVVGVGEPRPVAVFDNLLFLGTQWVSAWAIETSDGLILFDTLNNQQEAEQYIEEGLKALGRDPAAIRKIIVAHSHGDHYGGAKYLVEKYAAEVIMSEPDWKELEKPELQYDDTELWGRPPARDVSVADGDEVTLGDTTVTILITPGHTPGTISAIVPVKDGDQSHKAIIWGGNGLNWGPVAERFVSMMDAADRIGAMAADQGIDVFLSNHSGLDGVYEMADQLAARETGADHPLVIGPDSVRRFTTVLRECVAAQLASFAPEAIPAD
jgi:metallo-beta-lactamase class B